MMLSNFFCLLIKAPDEQRLIKDQKSALSQATGERGRRPDLYLPWKRNSLDSSSYLQGSTLPGKNSASFIPSGLIGVCLPEIQTEIKPRPAPRKQA